MVAVVDLMYLAGAVATSPIWIVLAALRHRKWLAWRDRFRFSTPLARKKQPRVLIHAVSVGEVNTSRGLIDAIEALPNHPEVVVTVTTPAGFARALEVHHSKRIVLRFPFDASPLVRSFLTAVDPDVLVCVELELWPNLTRICSNRSIPIVVVNGRISNRGFRRYFAFRFFVGSMFRSLFGVVAQNELYAQRFRAMGTDSNSVRVGGTMKWDEARIADTVDGARALGASMGIDPTRPLVVAGSTGPGEESLLHQCVPEGVQLLCAPRRTERFDEAAMVLPGCSRRSAGDSQSSTDRFLLDTIGELRQAYSLADVVVVGRSFFNLYGSDMMEPVALGKAVVFGTSVGDFRETADALTQAGGAIECARTQLADVIHALLQDQPRRAAMAAAGRDVVRAHQGATKRNAALVAEALQFSASKRGGAL
ncbi:MAG: hypothetical protein O2800_02130 [Planctomycetota bacterium]|nr:hypothetical protein [Planctomycetota bacterium]